MRVGLRADEAHRRAAFSGAPRAADPVRVVHGRTRQIVVHHDRQLRDVEPAGGHVRRHEHPHPRRFEIGQRRRARALAEFAVERDGLDPGAAQFFRDVLGRIFRGHENQHPRPRVKLDQIAQQLRALRRIHFDRALDDVGRVGRCRRHLDARRIAEQALRETPHRRGKRRRKKQRLPLRRQQREDACEFVRKTQRKQPVRLVEHERRHRRERDGVVRNQVEQPARRRHQNVRATAKRHHLRVDGHAAVDHQRLQRRLRQVAPVVAKRVADLRRQLARRYEHQRPYEPPALAVRPGEALQQRQRKRRRLARTRLGRRPHIPAAQNGRNGRRLDRRGLKIISLENAPEERRRQAQAGE